MEILVIHPPDPKDCCEGPALSLRMPAQLLRAAKSMPDERGCSEGPLYCLCLER
jgi:hypothetical protein